MKITIEFSEVSACRVAFKCAYCQAKINSGHKYTKILSRKEDERFPITLKICAAHQPAILPLSLLWNRP